MPINRHTEERHYLSACQSADNIADNTKVIYILLGPITGRHFHIVGNKAFNSLAVSYNTLHGGVDIVVKQLGMQGSNIKVVGL
jgi:hypothetical protein